MARQNESHRHTTSNVGRLRRYACAPGWNPCILKQGFVVYEMFEKVLKEQAAQCVQTDVHEFVDIAEKDSYSDLDIRRI